MASFIGFFKRNHAVCSLSLKLMNKTVLIIAHKANHPPVCKKSNPIRFGVLGAANIAPEAFVLPTFSHAEAVTYAVAARDLKKARDFAKKYSIEKAYGGQNAYQGARIPPSQLAILF